MWENYCDEDYKIRWHIQPNPTWGQALNLMNRRWLYFGDKIMKSNLCGANGTYSPGLFTNYSVAENDYVATDTDSTTNRIQVNTINDSLPAGLVEGDAWTDMCNIFIFDPGTTIKTGSLMTFNDVTQISDPNIEAYDTPNQFGSKSLTGYTYGSATDYVSRDVKYVDRFG